MISTQHTQHTSQNINNNDVQNNTEIKDTKTAVKDYLKDIGSLFKGFLKWLIIAVLVGIAVGLIGTAFSYAINTATSYRATNDYMYFFLPLAGVVIVYLYEKAGMLTDKGTNTIILAARNDEKVKFRTTPLIFIATFLTHLFGGSAGREGAALQIGGSTAAPLAKLFRLDNRDTSVLIMCGMSAGFAALFGTPVAAAIFAIEVTIVGVAQYSAIVPCLISSYVSSYIATILKVEKDSFYVTGIPSFENDGVMTFAKIIALGICCALVSMLFCHTIHFTNKLLKKYLVNNYIRVTVAGAVICILTFVIGSTDYNGAGMNIIQAAVNGNARPEAFILKIIFTALTLGAGFKGGEIVPSLFVGATLGCTLGHLLGLSPSFAASVAMAAVFCGVTNCPLASIILTAELFGLGGFVFYAVAIGISYMLSGYAGLYSAQRFYHSKLKPIRYDKK